mgnify:CR=1 FL=1
MNVLIVDDQPEVVESMAAGVNWTRLGAENVFTAYSVKEAQGVFERDRIDILLCDIEMPPTNGFALLRWVQERFSGVVCIFLTAHAEFEYAQEAVKLGSFDYILQPAPYAEGSEFIARLAYGSAVEIGASFAVEGAVTAVTDDAKALLPMDDLVDKAAEIARLNKELANAQKQLDNVNAKLANEKFTSKAPQNVIDGVKANGEKLSAKIKLILETLESYR